MNIQNRMDSSLMMDRAVRKERQKLRSHTKSDRVSGQEMCIRDSCEPVQRTWN